MKCFVTETELQGYVPELKQYIWTTDTEYVNQKKLAESIVLNDLIDKGFLARSLQKKELLDFETEDSIEDTINAMRLVANITTKTTNGSFTLYGSNDNENWETVTTLAFTATGEISVIFTTPYKYYSLELTTGACEAETYLVETNYDLLYIFKWLELILTDSFKAENDQFHIKAKYFQEEYGKKLSKMIVNYDSDDDGEPDSKTSNIITITR